MNTSYKWLKDYVPDLEVSDKEFMDAMTLSGSKVECFNRLDADIENIVVGQVKKIEKHPDAEKLVVCQVDIGEDELLQIVTGAPNVAEGMKTPVVLDGGRVAGGHDGKKTPGGIKIKKGKLRGVVSNGMMCSIEELGSDRNFYPEAPEEGLYQFSDDVEVGADAIDVLGLHDVVFEYEITSNRVECYSVLGLAREAAATFNKKFIPPVVQVKENSENINDYFNGVTIEDKDLCSRYCARVVKNIKIQPSPQWMQRRLAAHGIRPINNIVDITNYVMEEYGQPMHAYDLDTIEGKEIIVRRAKAGETFVTLDGQERNLDENILMICDAQKAVGIAGIMGGENSMITDDVNTMLFEAACFDGTNIRLSSKKVGLRTDASGKFEKGLDPNNAIEAINRACQLVEELGAGEVVGGVVDISHFKNKNIRIKFEPEKINKFLGTDIAVNDMLSYFERLELSYDSDTKEIIIPSFRQDLECFADIAEEVARFYGYDNIPTTLPSGEATTGQLSFKLRIEEIAKNTAQIYGFSEAMSFSFESPKVFDKLLISQDSKLRDAVVISNPLGEDYSIMRTTPLNGILTSLAANYNHRNKNVRLYELANIYIPKQMPLTELPNERIQLTFGMYGDGDFFTMKGVAEDFLYAVGLKDKIVYNPEAGRPFLHPGRQADMIYDETVIGYIGELHPTVADNYNIGQRVYIAVIDMPEIVERATFDIKYTGIAKYPAVSRDLSMVMKKEVLVGQIEEIIESKGGQYLENYELFDIYEGEQIKDGYKSVAYSITFRANDKTLEESDVREPMDRILKNLEKIGIELRQ